MDASSRYIGLATGLYFTHAESTLNKEAIMSLFDNLDSEHHDDATERCLGFFIQAIADLEKGKFNC